MSRKIIRCAILLCFVALFVSGCTKSVGPDMKSDALKRAKEYAVSKYGVELVSPKAVRVTASGEKLTYNSAYIITEKDSETPYNIIVDYNEKGEFINIGDDRQSEEIISEFENWATVSNVKPATYMIGYVLPGGGENTITEDIYYFEELYKGDIIDYICNYKGNIYVEYDVSNEIVNKRLENKLDELSEGCSAKINIIASSSKSYNMGLSTAIPADLMCSISYESGKVSKKELKKRSINANIAPGIVVSTYVDETYKLMMDNAEKEYDSQLEFLTGGDIFLNTNNIHKNENGKRIDVSYEVKGTFLGSVEIAFSRRIYSERNVKVYSKDTELLSPSKSNDRFYYDDEYMYYLVKPGYIIEIVKEK